MAPGADAKRFWWMVARETREGVFDLYCEYSGVRRAICRGGYKAVMSFAVDTERKLSASAISSVTG